jgi:hypothetical protein
MIVCFHSAGDFARLASERHLSGSWQPQQRAAAACFGLRMPMNFSAASSMNVSIA